MEVEKQGCKGRSAGLQVPPEGSATALCKHMAAVHSREEALALKQEIWSFWELKQQELHLLPSFFLPFEVTAHWVLSGLV